MPASLMDSQLEALEPLADDEIGVRIEASLPLTQEIDAIRDALAATAR